LGALLGLLPMRDVLAPDRAPGERPERQGADEQEGANSGGESKRTHRMEGEHDITEAPFFDEKCTPRAPPGPLPAGRNVDPARRSRLASIWDIISRERFFYYIPWDDERPARRSAPRGARHPHGDARGPAPARARLLRARPGREPRRIHREGDLADPRLRLRRRELLPPLRALPRH